MGQLPDPLEHRQADHEILDLFMRRWSPRAFTGEAVSQAEVHRLFEAARWAPSTYNEQEWRFLYAHRETEHWNDFFNLLVEGNQLWCAHAGLLIVAISRKTFTRNGKPNPVHAVDTGMAIQNLLLQAASMPNVEAHGMGGFDRARARMLLQIPDEFEVHCMIAVGRPGDPDKLPIELREREVVTGRKAVPQFARAGKFEFTE